MSIKSVIISQIQQTTREHGVDLPPLTDDLRLLDSGLDSLTLAILVARLEDALGLDPFSASDNFPSVVTFGDFLRLYEKAAQSHDVDSRQAC